MPCRKVHLQFGDDQPQKDPMAATNSASSSAASTPVLSHEAYDPRATAAQGFVIRAAPPKALEAPSHPDEPYPSSSDDEMDEHSSKNGTPCGARPI